MTIAVILLAAIIGGTGDDVRYVDDDAPAGGDGRTWATAYRFLRDALDDPARVEIRVAAGLYRPDRSDAEPAGTGDRFATFTLTSGLRLLGGYAGLAAEDPDRRDPSRYVTTLSGDLLGDDGPEYANYDENSHHVVTTSGVNARTEIDGVTITAGHADGPSGPNQDGAGINNIGGSPRVTNCIFLDNVAVSGHYPQSGSTGGGMLNEDASPRIIGCVFDGNVGGASGGGGMYNRRSNPALFNCLFVNNYAGTNAGGAAMANFLSSPIVIGCTFRDNSTFEGAHGGAVRCQSESMPTFLDCLFEGNVSGGCGGAFMSHGLNCPIIERCTFLNNSSAFDGGAMCGNHTSTPSVRESVFIGNRSERAGGAVRFSNATSVVNCWFERNIAVEEGGGLALSGSDGASTVMGCVFLANRAERGGGVYTGTTPPTHVANCTMLDNIATESGGAYAGPPSRAGTLVNSIVRGNAPDQIEDGAAALVAFCNVEGDWPGDGNIDADPLFADRERRDLRVTASSPCIDAGWNLAVPFDSIDLDRDGDTGEYTPFDFIDTPRFIDAAAKDTGCGPRALVDMGAFEYSTGQDDAPTHGDLDGDGEIGFGDLVVMVSVFGTENGCRADLDVDGDADFDDLLALLVLMAG